jgi:hypothetical protein
MRQLIFILPLVATLAGCASAPAKPQIITQVKTVVIATPQPLLKPCPISAPPDQSTYMQSDMSGRENLLTNYIVSLLSDLKICNQQIESISKFQQKQIDLYNKDQ